MKITRFIIIIVGILQGIGFSFAQNESVITNFSATEFNGKVLLDWAITQGNTCNGITVLHSTDSINFTQIGSIEGICGSSAEIIYYDFTQDDPQKNATNYYRLSLGGVGFSWIISLHIIDPSENNYSLGSNPISSSSFLYLNNENHALLKLNIYNLAGKHVKEMSTTNSTFELNKDDFRNGKYVFLVSREFTETTIKGSFIVE